MGPPDGRYSGHTARGSRPRAVCAPQQHMSPLTQQSHTTRTSCSLIPAVLWRGPACWWPLAENAHHRTVTGLPDRRYSYGPRLHREPGVGWLWCPGPYVHHSNTRACPSSVPAAPNVRRMLWFLHDRPWLLTPNRVIRPVLLSIPDAVARRAARQAPVLRVMTGSGTAPGPGMDAAPYRRVRRTVRHGRQPAEEGAGTGRVARVRPHSGGRHPGEGVPPALIDLKVMSVALVYRLPGTRLLSPCLPGVARKDSGLPGHSLKRPPGS
jgi:hypothetical protein